MGFTYVEVNPYNPADSEKIAKVNLLVDSRVLFTSVPAQVAKNLELKPAERRRFKGLWRYSGCA